MSGIFCAWRRWRGEARIADGRRRVKAKEVDEAVAERCRLFGRTLPEVEFRALDIAATKPLALANLPLH